MAYLLLIILSWTGSIALAAPSSCPSAYALFAIDTLRIAQRADVQGQSATDSAAPTQIGVEQGALEVAQGALARGVLAAPILRLLGTSIDLGGVELFCGRRGKPGRLIRCAHLTHPVIPGSRLPLVAVFAGRQRVTPAILPKGQALPPGAYGRLFVPPKGTLQLVGGDGDYAFASITLAEGASLVCQSSCRVFSRHRVRIGPSAEVKGALSNGAQAKVHLGIQGTPHGDGLRARTASKFTGTVYSPTSRLSLGSQGTFIGSFIGWRVNVGELTTVRGPASPPEPCPAL